MRKSKFSNEQITAVLNDSRSGMGTGDVCRKHGITSKTLYNWRSKFGGMQATEVRRLKALEEENAKLKRIVANQALAPLVAKRIERQISFCMGIAQSAIGPKAGI